MQLKGVLTVLASLVPLVVSGYVGPTSCSSREFYWPAGNCCLPYGGTPNPPSPPKDTSCPPTSYYWGTTQGCCVPRQPPTQYSPPPQCPTGWSWYSAVNRCHKTPTPPTTPPSHPSPKPGKGYTTGWKKRSPEARLSLCPNNLDACPVSGMGDDYECVDTATELDNCGGCTSLGKGKDCTAIQGAWNVGCNQGSCTVYTCAGGFHIAADGKSCIPL